MAKRSRDEAAASKGGSLLKRREVADSDGATDTLDRTGESTKRRRIAGERRTPVDTDTDADTVTATETTKEPESKSGSDSTPKKARSKGNAGDSEARARDLAAKPRLRTRLAAPAWAALTGLVVGGVLTGLVYAGMQTFQAIYNTPAGDGVGAVVLVAVLVVSMLVGRFLLKWRGLYDPSATTLLGILLMAIVTLGVLLPIVFTAWMLLITPLLGAATYLVSHLLVTHFGNQT